jgi:hypothetical protein
MSEATQFDGTRLRKAIVAADNTFHKNKRKLRDLSSRFWVALMDLGLAAGDDKTTTDDLMQEVRTAHRQLGSPGDFGYGTPCGDALREVYDAYNELSQALEVAKAEVATS